MMQCVANTMYDSVLQSLYYIYFYYFAEYFIIIILWQNFSEVEKILYEIYYSTKKEKPVPITDQWNPHIIPVIEKWIADFLSDKSEVIIYKISTNYNVQL